MGYKHINIDELAFKYLLGMATVDDAITIINILHNNAYIKKSGIIRERLKSSLMLLAIDVAFSGNNKIDSICNIRSEERTKRGFALLTLAAFFR